MISCENASTHDFRNSNVTYRAQSTLFMNRLFRLLLAFNATSLLGIVYFANHPNNFYYRMGEYDFDCPHWVIAFLLILIPLLMSYFSLLLAIKGGNDSFKEKEFVEVQYANNSFLPSYLGYFFVALSINSLGTLAFVYFVLFIFTYKSQALYFNPLFLLFGYNFYNMKDTSGKTIFLITKDSIKDPAAYFCAKAYRVNDFTFIDRGEDV